MNELSPKPANPASLSDRIVPSAATPRRLRVSARWIRLTLFLVVLLGLLALAAHWGRAAVLFVHETDARIKADLIAVASEVDGRATDRPVTDGQAVTKGQVLVRFDDREALLRLEETDAQQATLLAEISRLEAEIVMIRERTESRVARAKSQLTEMTAGHELYEHELSFAKADYERARALSTTGAISSSRLERSHTDYLKARQELSRAQAEIAMAQAGIDEANADLAEVSVKRAERTRLEAELAEIAARRERLRIDLEHRTIVSPIDGVVGRTFVSAGERVEKGQRLMSLHNPAEIWVEANIRETEVGRVAIGQTVSIHVDAYPGETFEGRVERVGHAANSQYALLPRLNESGTFTKVTQRIEVRVAVEQRDGRLRPGMMVEVSINAPRAGFWPF
ncbi:transporter, membrane fusion protein (MFP) family [alpha proteobacterium BAL199]|jgi:membrane fusion protein, multidrug efflux system|nr:transporter, membrane fusion protein (MFP) family [alpha proteobacterium BAL199]